MHGVVPTTPSRHARRSSRVALGRGFPLVGAIAVAAAMVLESGAARAGGFEVPDNGTQAMGRGGAFVAKASDGTAIYYNPAGLARQRGTHVLVNGNLYFHSFEFRRIGTFPDDPDDAETPWGSSFYPATKNVAGSYFLPFVALTTDFGYFDRLTFGAGLFSPPVIGNRTFLLGVDGKPAASRYDFVQSRTSILYPTLSAGFRVTKWLDVGVSGHLVLGNFHQTSLSYVDLGPTVCKDNEIDGEKRKEDFRCDSRSTMQASGTAFAATIGAMARPTPSLAFGASFRTPTNISASGKVTPDAPRLLPEDQELAPGSMSYRTQLPWALRVGGRYIGMDADFELYDLELDVTYERWGRAQALGPIVTIPELGTFKNIETVVQHHYKNTIGVRGGGAYNFELGEAILSLRGGGYFDSSATEFAYTRLDYDTLAKVAGTIGVGLKLGSFGFDLGYAAIASIPRTVGSGAGEIRPVNLKDGGSTNGEDGQPLAAVNEGAYRGFTHIVALGVSVSIDSFFGPPRPIHYGNTYEPNYAGRAEETEPSRPAEETEKKPDEQRPEEKPTEEKKPEEKKPEEKPAEQKPPAVEPPEKPGVNPRSRT